MSEGESTSFGCGITRVSSSRRIWRQSQGRTDEEEDVSREQGDGLQKSKIVSSKSSDVNEGIFDFLLPIKLDTTMSIKEVEQRAERRRRKRRRNENGQFDVFHLGK